MACFLRFVLMLLLAFAAPVARAASAAETRAYNSGENAFQAGIWDRAEADFADFIEKFPTSARLPEAVLMAAQARLKQNNFSGGIDLLKARFGQAGVWADQFVFWLAEAYFQKGDFKAAGDTFEHLLQEFPSSNQRLRASLGQASAAARLGDWKRVIELLQQPTGPFQTAVKLNPAIALAAQGYLLLSEAFLASKDPAAASVALEPLARIELDPLKVWQRQYLVSRIAVAQNRPAEALQGATNLLALSSAVPQRGLMAESVAFTAGLLEQLGRVNEALAVYTNNLADGIGSDRQEQAMLKIRELSIARNDPGPAMQTLEAFLAKSPDSPAAPLALLTVGELRLRQHLAGATGQTNNFLQEALASFSELTNRFPSSPLVGRAQLNLGWGFSLSNNLSESESAFRAARDLIPTSLEQATAAFKLADMQFQQGKFPNAISNYLMVVEGYTNLPAVKTNLTERALYQAVRASLAQGDMPLATNLMSRIVADYPNGFHTDSAILLTGQQLATNGNPAAARAVFLQFLAAATNSPLRAEIELAIARTFECEGNWAGAAQQYEQWVASHPNHPKLQAANYHLGWAMAQSGREAEALRTFTNMVSRFADGDFVPLAQLWVADYYFRTGDNYEAELKYKAIFQSTNIPQSEFSYQARLMAGRAALARSGWKNAIDHFTNLISTLSCPVDLRVQAMFAYGNTLTKMDTEETNRLSNLETAIRIFATICESYPTNRLAPLAWGEKGNCLLQWAQYTKEYDSASNAFFQVIQAPAAGPLARSIARIGLGIVMEKKAEQGSAAERLVWIRRARDLYLDVFYGKPEPADAFWTSKAGWEAARLSEQTQQWSQAVGIYEQLKKAYPILSPRLDKAIRRAQEQSARGEK